MHKQLPAAATPQARPLLQRRIAAADRQIDRLMDALYGLTAAESNMIEEDSAYA